MVIMFVFQFCSHVLWWNLIQTVPLILFNSIKTSTCSLGCVFVCLQFMVILCRCGLYWIPHHPISSVYDLMKCQWLYRRKLGQWKVEIICKSIMRNIVAKITIKSCDKKRSKAFISYKTHGYTGDLEICWKMIQTTIQKSSLHWIRYWRFDLYPRSRLFSLELLPELIPQMKHLAIHFYWIGFAQSISE